MAIVISEPQPERNPATADPRAARSNEAAADFARELVTLLAVAVVGRGDPGGHADTALPPAGPDRRTPLLSADAPVAYPDGSAAGVSKPDGGDDPVPVPDISVPTVELVPSVVAALPGVAPVAGLFGVDVAAVEGGVRDLLAHATDLAGEISGVWAEDASGPEWWAWAAGAAVVTGWAGYAAWDGGRSRKEADTTNRGNVHVTRIG